MEKLLALVAELNDEEDIVIRFKAATWLGRSLRVQLDVTVIDSTSGIWEVRCEDVLGSLLLDESAHLLELTEDHPLLWEFKHETASAFFYAPPANADAAVGALYQAHENGVGPWIKFDQFLNNSISLSKLLAAGNGLLASGPMPLMNLYKETLRPHGVEVDIRFPRPPKIWDGIHWRQLELQNKTKVLLLGSSYVIGNEWDAQHKS